MGVRKIRVVRKIRFVKKWLKMAKSHARTFAASDLIDFSLGAIGVKKNNVFEKNKNLPFYGF